MISEADPAVPQIAAGGGRARYDELSIKLHWLTVLLVLVQFSLAELWRFAPRGIKHLMIVGHMSFGIMLAAVLIVRIIWRVLPGHRVRPATTGILELAAKSVHYVLYALLCVQAALGFLLRWSGHQAMSFFGLQIPPFFPPFSKPAHHLVGEAHNYVGWAIIIIAVGHGAAALFHNYVLHDDVLRRMLPMRYARQDKIQDTSLEQTGRR